MRTTMDIPDALYRTIKIKAASEGITVKEFILRGVQVRLKEQPLSKPKKKHLPVLESKEPGVLRLNNGQIFDILGFP